MLLCLFCTDDCRNRERVLSQAAAARVKELQQKQSEVDESSETINKSIKRSNTAIVVAINSNAIPLEVHFFYI